MLPNNQSSIHSAALNLQNIVTFLLHLAKELEEDEGDQFYLSQFGFCFCFSCSYLCSDCFVLFLEHFDFIPNTRLISQSRSEQCINLNKRGQIRTGNLQLGTMSFGACLKCLSPSESHWELPHLPRPTTRPAMLTVKTLNINLP